MKSIRITQIKSGIDRNETAKRTLVALGLKKLNASVEVAATPQILGMVRRVAHLVNVGEVIDAPLEITDINNIEEQHPLVHEVQIQKEVTPTPEVDVIRSNDENVEKTISDNESEEATSNTPVEEKN